MNLYRIYGITLESEVLFPEFYSVPSLCPNGPLRVSLKVQPFPLPRRRDFRSLYGVQYWFSADGRQGVISSCPAGSFRVRFDERAIEWKRTKENSLTRARLLCRGRVLGFLLSHLPSTLVLHGNGVVRDGCAFLFLGWAGHGKSTLTASLLQDGFSLLSDDLAVIRPRGSGFSVEPGAPEVRMWPHSLEALKPGRMKTCPLYPGTAKKRLFLGPGSPWRFDGQSRPLKFLYLLHRSRREKGVRIQTLEGKEALIETLRQLYEPMVKDPKVLGRQFKMAVRLAKIIPVKRLIYPSGLLHLPRVREAILQDVQ